MDSAPKLSRGSIHSIMVLGERPQNSILQITLIKEMASKTSHKKYRIQLSDGEYYTAAILSSQLNTKIESGDIKLYTVVILSEFNLTPTLDKQLLIAINVEPILPFPSIIGNPKNIISISQENSQTLNIQSQNQHEQDIRQNEEIDSNNLNSNDRHNETDNQFSDNANTNELNHEQNRSDVSADNYISNNQLHTEIQNFINSSSSSSSQKTFSPPLPSHLSDQNKNKNHGALQKHLSNFFNATQNTAKKHAYLGIDNLHPYIASWVILARVVMKGSVFNFNGRDGKPGKLLNITLKDKTGSEIRGTFFNEQVVEFEHIVEADKVYQISGGLIKEKNSRFNSTLHDYEISFNSSTKFLPMPDDQTIGKLTYRFRKLADLPNVSPKSSVDIIAYIITVNELQSVTLKDNKTTEKRDIIICDDSNVKCDMTLWDKEARDFPTEGGFIVAFKDAKLSDFKGRTLSSPSNLILNPTFPEAYQIQSWINNNQINNDFDFNKMATISNGGDISRSYLYLSQINDLELGTHEKPDYGTAIVTLSDVMLNRRIYYAACPNPECKFKGLTITDAQSYFCERCQRIIESPAYRYLFSIKVQDFTGSTFMSLLGDDQIGAIFTGKTAAEWHDETESMDENDIRQFFQDKFFMTLKLRCRIKNDQFNGKSFVKTNVFSAQKLDYADGAKFFANEINKFS